VWADPLLRIMVLWLGMIGATVASRDNRHIHIDLVSHFFSKTSYLLIQTFAGQFTSWVCLLVAWYGAHWVQLDFVDGLTGIQGTSRRSSQRALRYVHCRRWWSNAGVWAAKRSRVSTKSPV